MQLSLLDSKTTTTLCNIFSLTEPRPGLFELPPKMPCGKVGSQQHETITALIIHLPLNLHSNKNS